MILQLQPDRCFKLLGGMVMPVLFQIGALQAQQDFGSAANSNVNLDSANQPSTVFGLRIRTLY